MNIKILALIELLIFVILASWHFYWAFGGTIAKKIAIPEMNDTLAFAPSALLTALVGMVLLLFGILIAAMAGLIAVSLSTTVLSYLCFALAFALFARAIGEFRLVGFFKRIRHTDFARYDTYIYSPVCLFLSLLTFIIARQA
jgi:hypothetical protein